MSNWRPLQCIGSAMVMMVVASSAAGYIHFPPTTMPKMCKQSTYIRVLSIKKYDAAKGVILYELAETLKGTSRKRTTFKHVIGKQTKETQPIFDWVADGKQAVMFTIEGGAILCGYVFIDNFCYSVDHNRREDYWLLIRVDP